MIKAAGLLLSSLTLSTRATYSTSSECYDWTTISDPGSQYMDVAAGADGSFWYLSASSQPPKVY
jgi:hypothetical protein